MVKLLRRTGVLVLTGMLSVLAVGVGAQEINDTKKTLIDTLIKQMNIEEIIVQSQVNEIYTRQLETAIVSGKSGLDSSALSEMRLKSERLVRQSMLEENALSQLLYPIYDRHFTQGELGIMVSMNNTPFGARMASVLSAATEESLQASQNFTDKIVIE